MTPGSVIAVSDLSQTGPTRFDLRPDAQALQDLAADLGISALRKVRLAGELRAEGRHDWLLTARLGATVVQPCVVSLVPVTTRIETDVRRLFQADPTGPEGDDIEMPEDTDAEPLGPSIDLAQILTEALALTLPAYPRAEGAELSASTFAAPGTAPLSDDDVKPFAGLAALKDRLNRHN
ncbi:MAG: YceD family protein [Marinibacterium sp.]